MSLFFRDNGLKAIENLMEKKGKFDYILLETTGLADPGITHFANRSQDQLSYESCLIVNWTVVCFNLWPWVLGGL